MQRRRNTSSVGADRRRRSGRHLAGDRLLGLPNQNEWQNCKARRGVNVNPHPDFGGPKMSKKLRSRLWACRIRSAIWCVRWGRSAGARCETRRRRTSASVRRVGCKIYLCSPTQTTTLPEGVRHVFERMRMGVRCACTGRRKGALRMRSWRMRGASFRRCVVPVGRAVQLFGSCCATRPMRADGGVGKCAPCRRGSSPTPASAKTMADGTDWRAVGARKMRHKERRLWGH